MQVLTFTYTDPKLKVSSRVLAVDTKPSEFYEGVDLSELGQEEQGLYLREVAILKETYRKSIENLNNLYDLNHRYRRFKPSGMSDIKTETI